MYKDSNQIAYLQELGSGKLDRLKGQFAAYNRRTRIHIAPTKAILKGELADLMRKEEFIGMEGKILIQEIGGTQSEIIDISDLMD